MSKVRGKFSKLLVLSMVASGLGNYQTAYKKSGRSVDEKHPHVYSGGPS